VRIGLVGAGGVAARHARVLGGFEDVTVVAVTDLDRDAAARLADTAGARACADLDSVLDARVDAVHVCVPPGARGPAELALVEAGVPFFVEKPLAADRGTAERIAGAVEARGLLTAVGYHWRHLDTVAAAAALLRGRRVALATAVWLDKTPPVPWWTTRAASGGQVVEQATHLLDLLRVLAGEVVEVSAAGSGPGDVGDVDRATVATLRFASGAVGAAVATSVLGWKQRSAVEVFADGLALWIDEEKLVVRDADGERTVLPSLDPRTAVDRAFVDALGGQASPGLVSYGEALHTHRLACAVAGDGALTP
jgi:predicted dehydrogenase